MSNKMSKNGSKSNFRGSIHGSSNISGSHTISVAGDLNHDPKFGSGPKSIKLMTDIHTAEIRAHKRNWAERSTCFFCWKGVLYPKLVEREPGKKVPMHRVCADRLERREREFNEFRSRYKT